MENSNLFDVPQNPNLTDNLPQTETNQDVTNMDNNTGFMDSKALRIMSRMGYESGTGLGINKQGIVEPIELQVNQGRRGLGLVIENLQASKESWDFSLEEIIIEEKVEWLMQSDKSILEWLSSDSNFEEKLTISAKITGDTICNETKYCDGKLVKDVLKAKEVLDGLDSMELCRARARANAFETLRSVFFMNRAALKMANIDAATDFLFSNVDRQEEHKQQTNPYYFADICAGPGGFSEYIFWRKKWAFKGFGMTLKDDNDFKLYTSTCAACETFEPLYGIENDGNVYIPDNIKDFSSRVKSSTGTLRGVHFVMGDGGFSVENQENLQEVLSRQLYVCQCYIALNILKSNGHFVVKLFDLFTSFSVGLIYLMSRCFKKIGILKPNSSRPANSERYLICSNLKDMDEETEVVTKYLEYIVQKLYDIRNNPLKDHLDINGIVPDDVLESDFEFVRFIRNSIKRLAEKQLLGLMKLAAFIRDPTLIDPRQNELKEKCLKYWQIPDKPRNPRYKLTCDDLLLHTITNTDFMYSTAKILTDPDEWRNIFSESENWCYTFSTITEHVNCSNIFASLGLNLVYKFDVYRQKWDRLKNIELVRGTICFGELVTEFSKHDETIRIKTLHIIDALRLGDTPLTQFSFQERISSIDVYCKAVNKQSRLDLANIRYKETIPLNLITRKKLPSNLQPIYTKPLIPINSNNWSPTFNVNSILLLKTDESESFDTTVSSRLIIMIPSTVRRDPEEQVEFWDSFCSSLELK